MCHAFDLVWYPKRRHARAAVADHTAAEPDALIVHRRHGPEGRTRPAFVEAGMSLLGPPLRDTCRAARLVWVPTEPTRCILARRDRSGVLQLGVTPWVRPGTLAEPMEQLDRACELAFHLAIEEPATAGVLDQLDAVLTLTLQIVELLTRARGGDGPPAQLEAP